MGAVRESAVFVWPDRALFLGDRSETGLHAHHAVEISVALDERGVEVGPARGPVVSGPAVAVRSDAPHHLTIPGPKVAVLYLEPRSVAGAGVEGWLGDRAIAPLPGERIEQHAAGLRSLFRPGADLAIADRVARALVDDLAPEPDPPALDERVRDALGWIEERLDRPPTLGELAARADLSAGRFGHLFKAQVGLPVRRWVLWMRLRRALTLALDGTPMTEAAHEAGFSDSAHFTRTCQRMFGLPPTAFAPVDVVYVASSPGTG